MIPNSSIHEFLMLERHRQLQRVAKQQRLLAGLPRHRRLRYLMRRLGTLFVAIGTCMQQFEQPDQPAVCDGTQDGTFHMKGHAMSTQIQAEEQLAIAPSLETSAPERDGLAQCGFTAEEIAALLWLRSWYQSGGSDRMEIVRHWEFLKWLVMTGKLEG
jgi:hypothetical protein